MDGTPKKLPNPKSENPHLTPHPPHPFHPKSTPRDTAGGSHVLNNSESLGSKFTSSRCKVMKPKPNLGRNMAVFLASELAGIAWENLQ